MTKEQVAAIVTLATAIGGLSTAITNRVSPAEPTAELGYVVLRDAIEDLEDQVERLDKKVRRLQKNKSSSPARSRKALPSLDDVQQMAR
tara:strand:+ start:1687 stop:1953 length:267 start_codon:yes stop_codon:yes gene_type:complete